MSFYRIVVLAKMNHPPVSASFWVRCGARNAFTIFFRKAFLPQQHAFIGQIQFLLHITCVPNNPIEAYLGLGAVLKNAVEKYFPEY